jgi:hypothetical protein
MTGDVANFAVVTNGFRGEYRVRVARDLHRGGYSAKLISVGIGTIMEPHGDSPRAALEALVHELAIFGDRKLAKAIAGYAWFPLTVKAS